jgi:hypothetical protein
MDVGILCGGSGDSTTNQVYAVIRTKIEKSISLISVKESRAHFFHFFFLGGPSGSNFFYCPFFSTMIPTNSSLDSTEELLNTVIYSTIVKGFTMSRQHDQASRLPG